MTWKVGVKTIWAEMGDSLIQRDGLFCYYCGIRVLRTKKPVFYQSTIDHVIPKSKGGGSCLGSLVISCRGCNMEKGDGDFLPFYLSKQELREANKGLKKG